MKLFAIRYFVVKSSEVLFTPKQIENPQDIFLEPLLNKVEVEYYKRTYTTRLIDSAADSQRYALGYFLKSIDSHLINLDSEMFTEQDIENWEKLLFILDRDRQLFICQHSSNISTPENVRNVLYKMSEALLAEYGYDLKLEFIVDEFKFWEIVKDSQGIYQIAFSLNAPNLFGGTKKANEWLKKLKEKHNMTSVKVDFRNENANLLMDEEELESYRDYADSGGGAWTLGVLRNNKKKKFVSQEHLKQSEIELDSDDPKYILNNLINIREQLIGLINNFDK